MILPTPRRQFEYIVSSIPQKNKTVCGLFQNSNNNINTGHKIFNGEKKSVEDNDQEEKKKKKKIC